MTTRDDATFIAWGLMIVLGIPCILLATPAILLALAGDRDLAYYLIGCRVHWVAMFTILLTIAILVAGAVLE